MYGRMLDTHLDGHLEGQVLPRPLQSALHSSFIVAARSFHATCQLDTVLSNVPEDASQVLLSVQVICQYTRLLFYTGARTALVVSCVQQACCQAVQGAHWVWLWSKAP